MKYYQTSLSQLSETADENEKEKNSDPNNSIFEKA